MPAFQASSSSASSNHPRLLIIGAGSRGNAYAHAVHTSTSGQIVAIAEPLAFKRQQFGRRHIWGDDGGEPAENQQFKSWQAFLEYEKDRRRRSTEREKGGEDGGGEMGIDGIFVCTLDDTHREIIEAFAPLGVHIMSEKPLATTLADCLAIYRALKGGEGGEEGQEGVRGQGVFSIGHVLRYSPHNMLLRRLVLGDGSEAGGGGKNGDRDSKRAEESGNGGEGAIGEVLSMEHTEPVGWWHFAHSYVRGNWRKESMTAPSLLTKSCHDIDFLLWMLCSPSSRNEKPHLPNTVSSTGSLTYFKRLRKPKAAATATNCLECPIEKDCIYSAKKIYVDKHLLGNENTDWPVAIVEPEVEECWRTRGKEAATELLLKTLAQDYSSEVSQAEIDRRPWFGRCVWESENDVCDDQTVTMQWEEEEQPLPANGSSGLNGRHRGAKSATFHMIAFTEAQCLRRGRIYGTLGEIAYDSLKIEVHDFRTGKTQTHWPEQPGGGHGGGDGGLARQYVRAIDAVKNQGAAVQEAQAEYIGCTVEEAVRSHAMVFAAEEARKDRKIVDWPSWWKLHAEQ